MSDRPALTIERYRDDSQKRLWRWRAVAANGKIVADSGQGYRRKKDMEDALTLLGLSGDAAPDGLSPDDYRRLRDYIADRIGFREYRPAHIAFTAGVLRDAARAFEEAAFGAKPEPGEGEGTPPRASGPRQGPRPDDDSHLTGEEGMD